MIWEGGPAAGQTQTMHGDGAGNEKNNISSTGNVRSEPKKPLDCKANNYRPPATTDKYSIKKEHIGKYMSWKKYFKAVGDTGGTT